MDGPEVFRHAVSRMREATLAAAAHAGLSLDEIDLFVPHQANARITRALGERLGLPTERVVDCIETLGNASAATLPVALHQAGGTAGCDPAPSSCSARSAPGSPGAPAWSNGGAVDG